MSEPTKVYIEPGKRTGRSLANERAMHAALDEGKLVYTRLNGVWFSAARIEEDPGRMVYTALAVKPVGL